MALKWVYRVKWSLYIYSVRNFISYSMWDVTTCVSTKEKRNKLNDVLVVPHLKKNLVSVRKFIYDNSCIFEFTSSDFAIKDQNLKIIARGHKRGQLYALDGVIHQALSDIRKWGTLSTVWHQRLGHSHSKILSLLKEQNIIDMSYWIFKPNICISCQMRKSCGLPFKNDNKISKFPFQKIHCDIWRLTLTAPNQGFWYYAIFIDDFSIFTWLYPLKQKFVFFSCFIKFHKLVENQLDLKIKIFQCDRGRKFSLVEFVNDKSI